MGTGFNAEAEQILRILLYLVNTRKSRPEGEKSPPEQEVFNALERITDYGQ